MRTVKKISFAAMIDRNTLFTVMIGLIAVLTLACAVTFCVRVYNAINNPFISLPPDVVTPTPIVFAESTAPPSEEPVRTPTVTPMPTPTEYITAPPIIRTPSAVTAAPTPTKTKAPTAAPTAKPTPTPESMYKFNENIVNILLMGVDTGLGRDITVNGYHSDVIMLLSIDQKAMKATCISIPRDTYTTIDKLRQDGKYTTITGQKVTRINAAFAQGGGASKQSYQNTMRAVSRLLGNIPINFYIGVNMDGFPAFINALGGLEFEVEFDFTNYDSQMTKGAKKTWTGYQTLNYVRQRKNIPDSRDGDIGRTYRQRQILMVLAKKVKQMGAVELAKRMYEPMREHLDTNLSLEQTVSLASLLHKISTENMDMRLLPGYISGEYYMPDKAKIDKLVLEKFFSKN